MHVHKSEEYVVKKTIVLRIVTEIAALISV